MIVTKIIDITLYIQFKSIDTVDVTVLVSNNRCDEIYGQKYVGQNFKEIPIRLIAGTSLIYTIDPSIKPG